MEEADLLRLAEQGLLAPYLPPENTFGAVPSCAPQMLHAAVRGGYYSTATALSQGIGAYSEPENGVSAFTLALELGAYDVARLVHSQGLAPSCLELGSELTSTDLKIITHDGSFDQDACQFSVPSVSGLVPAAFALLFDHPDVLRLIKLTPDAENYKDKFGRTFAHLSGFLSSDPGYLVPEGSLTVRDSLGFTPLEITAIFGCEDYFKRLLAMDKDADRARLVSLALSSPIPSRDLILRNLDINIAIPVQEILSGAPGGDQTMLRPLFAAARAGNSEALRLLLPADEADCEAAALLTRDPECFKMLQETPTEKTAFHGASLGVSTEISPVEAARRGWSALLPTELTSEVAFVAAQNGWFPIAQRGGTSIEVLEAALEAKPQPLVAPTALTSLIMAFSGTPLMGKAQELCKRAGYPLPPLSDNLSDMLLPSFSSRPHVPTPASSRGTPTITPHRSPLTLSCAEPQSLPTTASPSHSIASQPLTPTIIPSDTVNTASAEHLISCLRHIISDYTANQVPDPCTELPDITFSLQDNTSNTARVQEMENELCRMERAIASAQSRASALLSLQPSALAVDLEELRQQRKNPVIPPIFDKAVQQLMNLSSQTFWTVDLSMPLPAPVKVLSLASLHAWIDEADRNSRDIINLQEQIPLIRDLIGCLQSVLGDLPEPQLYPDLNVRGQVIRMASAHMSLMHSANSQLAELQRATEAEAMAYAQAHMTMCTTLAQCQPPVRLAPEIINGNRLRAAMDAELRQFFDISASFSPTLYTDVMERIAAHASFKLSQNDAALEKATQFQAQLRQVKTVVGELESLRPFDPQLYNSVAERVKQLKRTLAQKQQNPASLQGRLTEAEDRLADLESSHPSRIAEKLAVLRAAGVVDECAQASSFRPTQKQQRPTRSTMSRNRGPRKPSLAEPST